MSQLVSMLVFLVAMALFAVSMWPDVFRGLVAGFPPEGASRWGLFAAAFLLFIVSSNMDRKARRAKWIAAWTEFANRHGGEVTDKQPRLDTHAIRLGTTARIPVGSEMFELAALRGSERTGTRFCGPCHAPADFKMFVIPQNPIFKVMASANVSGYLRKQLPKGAKVTVTGSSDSLALQEAEVLLFGDPMPTGDAEFDRYYMVRTSDAARAREFFEDGSLRHAFVDLHAKGRTFSWAIAPSPKTGAMTMEYDEWQIVTDVDRLEKIHSLMVRAADRVEQLPKEKSA